jgi:hypothetical protein
LINFQNKRNFTKNEHFKKNKRPPLFLHLVPVSLTFRPNVEAENIFYKLFITVFGGTV